MEEAAEDMGDNGARHAVVFDGVKAEVFPRLDGVSETGSFKLRLVLAPPGSVTSRPAQPITRASAPSDLSPESSSAPPPPSHKTSVDRQYTL